MPSPPEKEVNRKENTVGKIAERWLIQKATHTVVPICYLKRCVETVLHSTVFMWCNLGFPASAPIKFHLPSMPKKEANWKENTVGKISKRWLFQKASHTLVLILEKFYSITLCFATKKIRIFHTRFIAFPSAEFPKICWTIVKILRDFTEVKWRKSKTKPNYCWQALPFLKP